MALITAYKCVPASISGQVLRLLANVGFRGLTVHCKATKPGTWGPVATDGTDYLNAMKLAASDFDRNTGNGKYYSMAVISANRAIGGE